MFLGLTDPDTSLFYLDTDHSINKQKKKEKSKFQLFVTSFRLFISEKTDVNVTFRK
jgi:hypothetical protein